VKKVIVMEIKSMAKVRNISKVTKTTKDGDIVDDYKVVLEFDEVEYDGRLIINTRDEGIAESFSLRQEYNLKLLLANSTLNFGEGDE